MLNLLKIMISSMILFASLELSESGKSEASTSSQNEIAITRENINTFYPALVLEKEDESPEYIIPRDILDYQENRSTYKVFVAMADTQYSYMCPHKNIRETRSEQFNSSDYCLTKSNFYNRRYGPFLCENEVKPLIVQVSQTKYPWISCEIEWGYEKWYSFVYQECDVPTTKHPILTHTYLFCYDTETTETLFTLQSMDSPILFTHSELDLERSINFDMRTDDYGIFGNTFQKIKQAYDEGNNYGMVAKMLVSADFMEMGLLRKTTFHYVNVRPMQQQLVNIWETFSTRLKTLIIRKNLKFTEIYNGAFGRLTKDGNPIYLNNDQVAVPEIWCTMAIANYVSIKRTNAIVFIMHNFIDEDEPISNKYCSVDACSLARWAEFNVDQTKKTLWLATKFAYCCIFNREIADLFFMSKSANQGLGVFADLIMDNFE